MSKKDIQRLSDYLEHIVEAIERIHSYVEDETEIVFLENIKTQDAVIRNFEIIGEAAHNVEIYHSDYANDHSEIPWSVMYAMRNRVSHGYFKVDYELIWQTIHNDLPDLYQQIKKLLD